MRLFLLFLITVLSGVALSTSVFAQSRLFPHIISPEGEVLAPFADPEYSYDEDNADDPLDELYDPLGGSVGNSSKIDTPHRSKGQLGRWSSDIVIRALSFDSRSRDDVFTEIRKYFTNSGWQAYQNFLQTEGLFAGSKEFGFELSSFTLQEAEMLGKGAAGGAFKWVFDVPVTIEYGTNQKRRENVNIVIQITRVPFKRGEEDVKIETWKIERLQQ